MYILTSQSGLGSWDNCDSITNAHGVEMHHKVTCTLYSIVKVVQAQCNVVLIMNTTHFLCLKPTFQCKGSFFNFVANRNNMHLWGSKIDLAK
jgi:hypothetical protein